MSHVNPDLDYVVVRASLLPLPGERATVVRNGETVGRVAFRTESDGSMRAADLVNGEARRGDWVVRPEPGFPPNAESMP